MVKKDTKENSTTTKSSKRKTGKELRRTAELVFVGSLFASGFVLYFQASIGLQIVGAINAIGGVLILHEHFIKTQEEKELLCSVVMREHAKLILLLLVLVAGFGLVRNIQTTERKVELKNIEIKSSDAKLEELNRKYEELLEDKEVDNKTFNERLKELEKEKAELEAELVSKRQREAQEASESRNIAYAQEQVDASPTPVSGTCSEWMNAAGITDQANAYKLIMRESGCNPCSYNPGQSNCGLTSQQVNNTQYGGVACGIGQQLPCGKWTHAWNDPVGGMVDMQNYVFARYGTWLAALNHSYANGWY